MLTKICIRGMTWSDDDSLEDWMSEAYVRGFFNWQEYSLDMWPGPVLYSNKSNQTIVANMLNASGWVGSSEVAAEPDLVDPIWLRHIICPKSFTICIT